MAPFAPGYIFAYDGVNYIGDGGNDMYDSGNQLVSSLYNPVGSPAEWSSYNAALFIPYTSNVLTNGDAYYGTESAYVTREESGIFSLSVRGADPSLLYVGIRGNNGADGAGSYVTRSLLVDGNRVFFKQVVDGNFPGDPRIIHIWILQGDPGASQTIPVDTTDSDGDQINNPGPNFDYILTSNGVSGNFVSDTEIESVVRNYLGCLGDLAYTGGAGGDPHFKTWSGKQYDFYGHCDLVLLDNPTFGENDNSRGLSPSSGAGLSIHIRSAPYKQVFSYISAAAIRIKGHVLEIQGKGEHYIDGVAQTTGSTKDLDQYPVTSSVTKRGRYVYKIKLRDGQAGPGHGDEEIVIREYRNWLTISIYHATFHNFEGSTGLMGSFPYGNWVGRDGTTIHTDINQYGSDWVVKADLDGEIFQVPSSFPGRCDLPSTSSSTLRGRKLQEATVTKEEAQKACAHWGEQIADCIMDVLIADDTEVAQNGPL